MKKSDIALLNRVAQNLGIEIDWIDESTPTIDDPIGGHSGLWNPIDDEGDALRLAVEFGILENPLLKFHEQRLMICNGYDKFKLTRMSIVATAADMEIKK